MEMSAHPLCTRTKLALSFLLHVAGLPYAASFVADQRIAAHAILSFARYACLLLMQVLQHYELLISH